MTRVRTVLVHSRVSWRVMVEKSEVVVPYMLLGRAVPWEVQEQSLLPSEQSAYGSTDVSFEKSMSPLEYIEADQPCWCTQA